MKVITSVVVLLAPAMTISIKNSLLQHEGHGDFPEYSEFDYAYTETPAGECIDANGECTKPCHIVY